MPSNPASHRAEDSDDPERQRGFGSGPAWGVGEEQRLMRDQLTRIEKRQTVTDAALKNIGEKVEHIEDAVVGDSTAANPGLAGRVSRLEDHTLSNTQSIRRNAKRRRILEKTVDRHEQKLRGWTKSIWAAGTAIIVAAVAVVKAAFFSGAKGP